MAAPPATSTASRRATASTAAPPLGTGTPARRATALFRFAVGLLAVHVLDDRFLQPQPGTSAGDHLVSGLVPLALLGLAAWAFPRVRAGARGSLALVLVLPAILSGSEALYYGGKTGLSGDDWTGLLAMAAAPVLLGLGVLDAVDLAPAGRPPGPPLRPAGAQGGRGPRRRGGRGRPALGRLRRRARRARRRARRPARRPARGRDAPHERRARARGLVRPVAQPRRRARLPGSHRDAPAGAHARPPRLRRPALRPSRGGRQRGRSGRLGLGLRQGHPCRPGLPGAPPRRRPGADRRASACRSAGRCCSRRRRARPRSRRSWPRGPARARWARRSTTSRASSKVGTALSYGARDVDERDPPGPPAAREPPAARPADRAAAGVPHPRRRRRRRPPHPRLLPRRGPAEADLGGPGRPHPGHRRRSPWSTSAASSTFFDRSLLGR